MEYKFSLDNKAILNINITYINNDTAKLGISIKW